MNFGKFLSDRLGRIFAFFLCAALAALFLSATGTQPGILLLLLPALLMVFILIQLSDFFRQRSRLSELENILNGLDQKYLFAECAPPAGEIYERRLFELFRRAGRAMTGAVSDAQASQREYREYVERWVHEVKTPLTAARLIGQSLNGETRRRLIGELDQLQAHVERALFYARAESPERDCLLRQTKLDAIVFEAIENHRTLLLQSGIRIETKGLEIPVYTDEKWAVFLLGQLLQNAVRYRGESPVIVLSARSLGNEAQLLVQDNGIGIPSHELPRIFDRGFTGSNGRARGGSTGMGLYLCKKLAGFLELGLSLCSEEGKGTAVTLTFPARETTSCQQAEPSRAGQEL
ncbi:MAG: HAMP domain-containing histidine kinase [Provencibacterium sp.]|jgi:signal transduction histidine kinase|nr:HAMP domain-containing histidine kinase [Provencibacterium sp.]